MVAAQLTLAPRCWYAFEALGPRDPHSSWASATPIFIVDVIPLKSGLGLLDLQFIRAVADLRPTLTRLRLRVVSRERDTMVVTGQDWIDDPMTAAISTITMDWLERYCPRLVQRFNPVSSYNLVDLEAHDNAQPYLDEHLGVSADTITEPWRHDHYPSPLLPMSRSSAVMPFERRYAKLDAWLFLHPFSQKWLIYAETQGNTGILYIRRRAAGVLYYELPFEMLNDTVVMSLARVCLDRREREFGTPGAEAASLNWIIDSFLLGRWTEPVLCEQYSSVKVRSSWRDLAPEIEAKL